MFEKSVYHNSGQNPHKNEDGNWIIPNHIENIFVTWSVSQQKQTDSGKESKTHQYKYRIGQ